MLYVYSHHLNIIPHAYACIYTTTVAHCEQFNLAHTQVVAWILEIGQVLYQSVCSGFVFQRSFSQTDAKLTCVNMQAEKQICSLWTMGVIACHFIQVYCNLYGKSTLLIQVFLFHKVLFLLYLLLLLLLCFTMYHTTVRYIDYLFICLFFMYCNTLMCSRWHMMAYVLNIIVHLL